MTMKPLKLDQRLGPAATLRFADAELVEHGQTPYQTYSVWRSPAFGTLYCLDGDLMAAESDEYVVHESMVHAAALLHPAPRRAWVLGGGDGGSARELLRHASIEQVRVCELDAEVVALTARHLPAMQAGAFADPRVELCLGDARAAVAAADAASSATVDLLVFDLTAADGSAAPLHEPGFFKVCAGLLSAGGVLAVQLGHPDYQPALVRRIMQALRSQFAEVRPMLCSVPAYGGQWAMAHARAMPGLLPSAARLDALLAERRIGGLRHYNGAIHHAQCAIPRRLQPLFT